MRNPLVSVIVTTYNRGGYLEQAIKSIANQSYKNIEIIVIDDGSNFNYAGVICNQYPICKYFYKENGGLSSARNYGVKLAKGDYIAFLDDDDFWTKSKIEKQLEILLQNASIDCVHSSAAVVDENGKPTGEIIGAAKNKIHKRSGYVFWNALTCWVVKSPTPLIRKKVFRPDLMFDESIKVGEDVDFYQRMFYRHKVFYINEPLAFYRQYTDENRLSVQVEKYIGIEKKMYFNFKRMGIKNPIVLYFIALKLLKSEERKWNHNYSKNIYKINRFNLYIKPAYYLGKFLKQ